MAAAWAVRPLHAVHGLALQPVAAPLAELYVDVLAQAPFSFEGITLASPRSS